MERTNHETRVMLREMNIPSRTPGQWRSRIRLMSEWKVVSGIVIEGYGVASGPSQDYPYGALDRQRPIFKARGFDLDGYFNGSLNIDIRPATFKMLKPEYTFPLVEWTDPHPPETFSFSRC